MRHLALPLAAVFALCASVASADDGSLEEDPAHQLAAAVRALREGRAGDAITTLEALGDRGVVDPVVSYDRGLAYAARIHIGAEVPGDLGRAVHGFEEARDLSQDRGLTDDATVALTVVRGEIARRRMRAGQPVEVDPGRSLGRTLAHLLSENAWTWITAVASAGLAAGLFLRWLGRGPRGRVAGGVTAGVAVPVVAVAAAMTLSARHDRWNLREAVVVTATARPTDERGLALPGGTPLPEGARVEIIDPRGASARVRFGATDLWVASVALRELAR